MSADDERIKADPVEDELVKPIETNEAEPVKLIEINESGDKSDLGVNNSINEVIMTSTVVDLPLSNEGLNKLSALKSWLQFILAKYDINGNYSSYIKATSTKLAIIIVRPSVNKLQHFVAMETVT